MVLSFGGERGIMNNSLKKKMNKEFLAFKHFRYRIMDTNAPNFWTKKWLSNKILISVTNDWEKNEGNN